VPVETTTDLVDRFTPSPGAWEAFQSFRPRSAGGRPADTAAHAAVVILFTELDPPSNALVRYYADRLTALVDAETASTAQPPKPWDADHRRQVIEAHSERLRCLMVMLLAPRNVPVDAIAPIDFPGLAAIAVANTRPTP
jgi:hypothetical protein